MALGNDPDFEFLWRNGKDKRQATHSSSTTIRLSRAAPEFFSKTSMFASNIAEKELGTTCSPGLRQLHVKKIVSACAGKYSIGTRPRSNSIDSSAPIFSMNGKL